MVQVRVILFVLLAGGLFMQMHAGGEQQALSDYFRQAGRCSDVDACRICIFYDGWSGGALGLNEVALEIPVPKYWAGVVVQVCMMIGQGFLRVLCDHWLVVGSCRCMLAGSNRRLLLLRWSACQIAKLHLQLLLLLLLTAGGRVCCC
jgi:hypothetical protein